MKEKTEYIVNMIQESKISEKGAEKLRLHIKALREKNQRGIDYFKSLKEGVDYKKEIVDIKSPLDVYRIVPISEKGTKYFKGEY